MHRSAVKNIISGRKAPGVNNYMLEEVYFSDLCAKGIVKTDDQNNVTDVNPYQAWYDNGKYRFQFPSLWYSSVSNNKAIGLRKIEVRAPAYNGIVTIDFYRTGGSTVINVGPYSVSIHITPDMDIEAAMSTICHQINTVIHNKRIEIKKQNPDDPRVDYLESISLLYSYDADTFTAEFISQVAKCMRDGENDPTVKMTMDLSSDLLKLFGLSKKLEEKNRVEKYTFKNVWNRRFLFVHASFVSGTSFQYLGRTGEFYPKPSKMYRFNGDSQDFYFELSFDGRTPVKIDNAHFIVELSYIYHDNHYQAE